MFRVQLSVKQKLQNALLKADDENLSQSLRTRNRNVIERAIHDAFHRNGNGIMFPMEGLVKFYAHCRLAILEMKDLDEAAKEAVELYRVKENVG